MTWILFIRLLFINIKVESATLPVATYSKFQPLTTDFLDLTNPKAVLEMRLRHFACLSKVGILYWIVVYNFIYHYTKNIKIVGFVLVNTFYLKCTNLKYDHLISL